VSGAIGPLWVHVAVALAIALAAFGAAQLASGLGMPIVVGVTALWVAYVVRHGHRIK